MRRLGALLCVILAVGALSWAAYCYATVDSGPTAAVDGSGRTGGPTPASPTTPRSYAGITMPSTAPTDVQLAIRLLQSPDPEERAQAARWIGGYAEEARPAVPYLIRMLSDPHEPPSSNSSSRLAVGPSSPSRDALEALVNMREAALSDVLQVLRGCDKTVATGIVGRLGHTYEAKQEKFDDPWAVHRAVAGIMGEMKRKEAVGPLQRLTPVDDAYMRLTAGYALAEIGTDEAIDAVLPLLQDSDGGVCGNTAKRLGSAKATRAVPAILKLLDQKDTGIVSAAIEALGQIGDRRAIQPLKGLANDGRWELRRPVAKALIELGDCSLCATAARELGNERQSMSAYVVEEAAKAHDPRVTDAALKAIQDGRNMSLAVAALGTSSDPRALPALLELVNSGKSGVSGEALRVLCKRTDSRTIGVLTGLLDSPDAGTRNRALSALYFMNDKRAVPGLLKALRQDMGQTDRVMSALATARVGVEVQDDIISVLRNDSALSRWSAVAILGRIKTAKSVAALRGALKDINPAVRARTAYSLGAIGTKAAEDALISALMDPFYANRPDAAEALGMIGSARAIKYLKAALIDNSKAVRIQAAQALKCPENAPPLVTDVDSKSMGYFPTSSKFGRFVSFPYDDKRPTSQIIAALESSDAVQRQRQSGCYKRGTRGRPWSRSSGFC